jgi:hypothetical protein
VYKVKARVRCWKQHTCSACACVYRYKIERSAEGRGVSEAGAAQNAEQAVYRVLAKEVDTRPCPNCGLVQPDMVARRKVYWHSFATLVPLGLLPFVLLFSCWGKGIPHPLGALIGAGVLGAAALAHLLIALYDPNRDRSANREKAQADLAARKAEVVQPGGSADLFAPPRNLTWAHAPALLAVAAAALAFLAPAFVPGGQDLPANQGLRPAVVGPGEEVTVAFSGHNIRSVDGRWRGRPSVQVLNAAEFARPPVLAAEGRDDDWGDSFMVKPSQKYVSPRLEARLQIPGDPALGGKSLRVRVAMDVAYPSASGEGFKDWATGASTFANRTAAVQQDYTIRLADAAVLRAYRRAWWTWGSLGVLGGVFGGGLLVWLGLSLRSRAHPTELMPIRL